MSGHDVSAERAIVSRPTQTPGRSATLELVASLYVQAPHIAACAPLCKRRDEIRRCSSFASTDGRGLSALVAYSRGAIEFTWARPGRLAALQRLLRQLLPRLGPPSFLPLLESGRSNWSQFLEVPVLRRCFRALHRGERPTEIQLPADLMVVELDPRRDLEAATRLMNAAYPSLRDFMCPETLRTMAGAEFYFAPGWFFLAERSSGERVGLAICGWDRELDEGFIEWVELLPRVRRRGLGVVLVNEAVRRLSGASLITVAGSLDAPFAVGDLYRKCGFEESRQWTILGRESPSASESNG